MIHSFKQKGFSLVETMIGIALMGGVSLLVSQFAMQADQVKVSSEATANNYTSIYEIQSLLNDKDACKNSFQGRLVSSPITELRDKNNAVKFSVGQAISSNLTIGGIALSRNATETVVAITLNKTVKRKDGTSQTTSTTQSFPINAQYSSTNTILGCESDVGNHVAEAVDNAIEEMCQGMNLEYNSTEKRCYSRPQLGVAPAISCPLNQTMIAFQYNNGTYTTSCSDTLGMSGTCSADQLLRRNPDQTFSCVDIKCPNNGVFLGLNPDGTSNCLSCPSGNSPMFVNGVLSCNRPHCPNGTHYMAGIDSNGNAICNDLVDSSAVACPNGKLAVSASGGVKFECCTPDCSAAGSYCSGDTFVSANNCGMCTGTQAPDCSNSLNYCTGASYNSVNGCGICSGSRPAQSASWFAWSATSDYRIKPNTTCSAVCNGGTIPTQRKYTRACDELQACGGITCQGEFLKWVDEGSQSCNTQACDCNPTTPCSVLEANACAGSWAGANSCGVSCGMGNKFCGCIPAVSCEVIASQYCTGQNAGADTCGNLCGTGTKACDCVPAVPCSMIVPNFCPNADAGQDSCGNLCGNGTKIASPTCSTIAAPVCNNQWAGTNECGDNCGMGQRPPSVSCGTIAAGVCYNTSAGADECGNSCGMGTYYPSPSCADNRANTCVGVHSGTDSCGGDCGIGTYSPTQCPGKRASTCTTAHAGFDECGNNCGAGSVLCREPMYITYRLTELSSPLWQDNNLFFFNQTRGGSDEQYFGPDKTGTVGLDLAGPANSSVLELNVGDSVLIVQHLYPTLPWEPTTYSQLVVRVNGVDVFNQYNYSQNTSLSHSLTLEAGKTYHVESLLFSSAVPVNCVGSWGGCSASCGGGTQTYTVSTPASGGGAACPFANGATQSCNTDACSVPVNCVGSWGACSASCGGGIQTYTVSTPPSGGGAGCPSANGDTQSCNTHACPVNCVGSWGACSVSCGGGTQTYTVSTPESGGGSACPSANGATQSCNTQSCAPVDCSSFANPMDETNGCVDPVTYGSWNPVSAECECRDISGPFLANCDTGNPDGSRSGLECRPSSGGTTTGGTTTGGTTTGGTTTGGTTTGGTTTGGTTTGCVSDGSCPAKVANTCVGIDAGTDNCGTSCGTGTRNDASCSVDCSNASTLMTPSGCGSIGDYSVCDSGTENYCTCTCQIGGITSSF